MSGTRNALDDQNLFQPDDAASDGLAEPLDLALLEVVLHLAFDVDDVAPVGHGDIWVAREGRRPRLAAGCLYLLVQPTDRFREARPDRVAPAPAAAGKPLDPACLPMRSEQADDLDFDARHPPVRADQETSSFPAVVGERIRAFTGPAIDLESAARHPVADHVVGAAVIRNEVKCREDIVTERQGSLSMPATASTIRAA